MGLCLRGGTLGCCLLLNLPLERGLHDVISSHLYTTEVVCLAEVCGGISGHLSELVDGDCGDGVDQLLVSVSLRLIVAELGDRHGHLHAEAHVHVLELTLLVLVRVLTHFFKFSFNCLFSINKS